MRSSTTIPRSDQRLSLIHILLDKAKTYQSEIDRKLAAKMPTFSRDYWWNAGDTMQVKMEPTRKGFRCV